MYKTEFISYDYEPIYALGSNLGIGDRIGMLKLLKAVEDWGLDAISTGVVLAWATEAQEKGLITKDETLLDLRWGDWKTYLKAIQYIVQQPNEFYKVLALGVEEASKRNGGADFALAFNKVEPAGYLTGPLYFISLAIGSRHSHLDAGAYSLDQKLLSTGASLPSPKEAVERIVEEEAWRQILSSLVICFFARGVYKADLVAAALDSLGYSYSEDELKKLGREIYLEKQRLKREEGFSAKNLSIPGRLYQVDTPLGKIDRRYVEEALAYFDQLIKEG